MEGDEKTEVSIPIERRVPNLLLEWRMNELEKSVKEGFNKVDGRFEKVNERFDKIESRTIANLVAFILLLLTVVVGFLGTIFTLLHR